MHSPTRSQSGISFLAAGGSPDDYSENKTLRDFLLSPPAERRIPKAQRIPYSLLTGRAVFGLNPQKENDPGPDFPGGWRLAGYLIT